MVATAVAMAGATSLRSHVEGQGVLHIIAKIAFDIIRRVFGHGHWRKLAGQRRHEHSGRLALFIFNHDIYHLKGFTSCLPRKSFTRTFCMLCQSSNRNVCKLDEESTWIGTVVEISRCNFVMTMCFVACCCVHDSANRVLGSSVSEAKRRCLPTNTCIPMIFQDMLLYWNSVGPRSLNYRPGIAESRPTKLVLT